MPADVSIRLELIGDLPIVIDNETSPRALHEILALTRAQNLTTYDATYLELAIRRGLPLATNDKRLRSAGMNTGVQIIPV